MLATITDYTERVRQGKEKESVILDTLRAAGMSVKSPTAEEDKVQKIDGWIIDTKGVRHSLQIKFRENGDDILFEIIKDIRLNTAGRDMICQAEYYFVVNSRGTGRLFLTAPIKRFAGQIEIICRKDFSVKPDKNRWIGTTEWEAKITYDRASGNRKLMGYFSPKLFAPIVEIQCYEKCGMHELHSAFFL